MICYKNIQLQRVKGNQKGKAKYIVNGNECFAEEAVMSHYGTLGCKGLWTENTYWWMLMALFFWDTIFARIRGAVTAVIDDIETELDPDDERFAQVFAASMQRNGMPHDFFTPEFRERRKALIGNRIQELRHSDLEQVISDSYKKNYGQTCRPIEDWDKYKLDALLIAVRRMDEQKLIRILERLISNFNYNRSGLPDLIIYDDEDFFFSEVKSEKDTLSNQQREWHSFLSKVLDSKVEIVLINRTEEQMKRARGIATRGVREVTVSFGHSSSKKREEAIDFIQKQKSYFTEGEGKGQVHGAKFTIDEDNVENIFAILDLTIGWKTQKIRIDEDISNSSELRGALRCFREKTSKIASLDYCRRGNYDSKVIKSGCRALYFHEFENEEWRDYGFIDTTKGEWIFERDRIHEQTEKEIDRLKYCPLLNVKKVRNLAKKLPERINPKTHHGWAFISHDYKSWFWHTDRWLSTLGETNFPGFSLMVGVQKLRKKDMSEAVGYSELSDSRAVSHVQTRVTYPSVVSEYVSDDQKMMELIDSFGRLVEKSIIKKRLFKKKQDELMKSRRKAAKTLRKKKPNQRIVSAFAIQVSVVRNLVREVSRNENLSRKDIKKLNKNLKRS